MRGTRRFGWLATAAIATGLVVGSGPAGAASLFVESRGELSKYTRPTARTATDGATADLWAVAAGGSTTFFLFLSDLDTEFVGETYGVHIHVGPCVEAEPLTSGPHYNTGGTPSRDTEVWLDFTVLPGGYGFAYTTVPFTIEPGDAQSLVIHAQPTQEGGSSPGAAGGRMACLPVEFQSGLDIAPAAAWRAW